MKFNVFRGELVTQGSGFSLRPLQDSLVFFLRTFITRSNKAVGGVSNLSEEF